MCYVPQALVHGTFILEGTIFPAFAGSRKEMLWFLQELVSAYGRGQT